MLRKTIRPDGCGRPKMSQGLSPEAQREWKRVADLLEERSALDKLDKTALDDYARCWQRLRECEADIAARGVLVRGDRGLVKNPACQLARVYRDQLIAWSKELGLTPTARARLGIKAPRKHDPNDPWERLAHGPGSEDPNPWASIG